MDGVVGTTMVGMVAAKGLVTLPGGHSPHAQKQKHGAMNGPVWLKERQNSHHQWLYNSKLSSDVTA
jgi:hypothetical protein